MVLPRRFSSDIEISLAIYSIALISRERRREKLVMIIELEPTVFSDPCLEPVNTFRLDEAKSEEFRIVKVSRMAEKITEI